MMSPDSFLKEYENAGYFELMKLKNELVQRIAEFEREYEMGEKSIEDFYREMMESPDGV